MYMSIIWSNLILHVYQALPLQLTQWGTKGKGLLDQSPIPHPPGKKGHQAYM